MKWLKNVSGVFIVGSIILIPLSCKKDLSYQKNFNPANSTVINTSLVAKAGLDIDIYLPTNYCTLNGSSSYDPNGHIVGYQWRKILGDTAVIANANKAQTTVTGMINGVYQFELRVIDNDSTIAKDTVQVNVYLEPSASYCATESRPRVNASLTPIGQLSEPRIPYVGAAGSKIVFAGGFYYTGPNYYAVSPMVDIYDVNTHNWEIASLSRAREGIAVASFGNKIFFGGGGFFDIAWDNVDIYDASTNTWVVDHLSEPRIFAAAAAVGNKVYIAGGYTNNSAYISNSEPVSKTVDIYDLSTGKWSTMQMPRPRAEFSAVALNNKIYFAGGSNNVSGVDIFDVATNSWSSANLSAVSGVISGVAKGDNIYWAGIANGLNSAGCKAETFHTGNFSTSVNCLSYSRYAPYSVTRNDDIAFFSQPIGFAGGDIGPMKNQFDIYNPSKDEWSIGILPINAGFQPAIQVNNTIYMTGGKISDYACSREVYIVNW